MTHCYLSNCPEILHHMWLEKCSPMFHWMEVNSLLNMHRKLYCQINGNMPSWKRRHCHWCMGSWSSISTYMGGTFTLLTNNHPVTVILGPKKGNLPLAAACLLRLALLLSTHQYASKFHRTQDNCKCRWSFQTAIEENPSDWHFPIQKHSILAKFRSCLSQLISYKQQLRKIQSYSKYILRFTRYG